MRAVAVACVMTVAAWAQKFEVATIKQAQMISAAEMRTGTTHLGLRVSGMRVEIRLNSLRSMIRLAYGVSDDQIVGPPSIGVRLGTLRRKCLRPPLEHRFHRCCRRCWPNGSI